MFALYYLVPARFRYLVLLAASYVFYAWGEPRAVLILLLTTAITYTGGLLLEKRRSAGLYRLFFVLNLSVLAVFKYTNFALSTLNQLVLAFNPAWRELPAANLLLPVGLSFYVFQSTSYLGDVYRRGLPAEKNPLRYAAFVAYFPTLLSGPIQRARELLPQLRAPRAFDFDRAVQGTLLLCWGFFEKVVVANSLAAAMAAGYAVDAADPTAAAFYIAAAACFSLYIYADFSSYSDMARGLSRLLGIEVRKNFDNPYLSTSLSEFWTRWHISLNEWFVENIYIPLGGSRRGTARKYLNMMVVFLISGLWHGASWNFVFWGVLNGALAVAGRILQPARSRLYRALRIDESAGSIQWFKKAVVFFFITLTWVFFRNDLADALVIVRRILTCSYTELFVPELLTISGSAAQTFAMLAGTGLFCAVQLRRQNEHGSYLLFRRQPALVQYIVLALVLYVSLVAVCSGTTTLNTDFLYFQF